MGTTTTIAPSVRTPVPSVTRYAGGPEGVGSLQTVGDSTSSGASRTRWPPGRPPLSRPTRCSGVSRASPPPPISTGHSSPRTRPTRHGAPSTDYWPAPLVEDSPGLTDQQTTRRDDGDARAVASSTLAEPALGAVPRAGERRVAGVRLQRETGWRSAGYDREGTVGAGVVGRPGAAGVAHPDARHRAWGGCRRGLRGHRGREPAHTGHEPELAGDVDPARYAVAVGVPSGPTRSLRLVVEVVRDSLRRCASSTWGRASSPVEPWVRLPRDRDVTDLVSLEASMDDRSACYPSAGCSPARRTSTGSAAAASRSAVHAGRAAACNISGTVVSTVGADDLLRPARRRASVPGHRPLAASPGLRRSSPWTVTPRPTGPPIRRTPPPP